MDKNSQHQHSIELHLYSVLKSVNVRIENVHTRALTHIGKQARTYFGASHNDDHYKQQRQNQSHQDNRGKKDVMKNAWQTSAFCVRVALKISCTTTIQYRPRSYQK